MNAITYLLLVFPIFLSAQVGIGTANPTAMLDVNGTMRVRQTMSNANDAAAKDSILVVNNKGDVGRVTSKQIVNSYLKSFVKGSFFTAGDKSLALSSGTQIVPFDYEEFDYNDEFNTSTHTFTAKQSGLYAIGVQVKTNSTVSVALNLGVAIQKNGIVIARNGFANIGITVVFLTINVTPPFRSTQTLVQLNADETIRFSLYSDLINIGILGSREDCFFTIYQLR